MAKKVNTLKRTKPVPPAPPLGWVCPPKVTVPDNPEPARKPEPGTTGQAR